MFDFIDDIKLKIKQDRERRNLEKAKQAEFKVLNDKKQYEITKESLDNEIEIEMRKAKIRKQQAISPQKAGTKAPEQKSAFGKFLLSLSCFIFSLMSSMNSNILTRPNNS